MTKSHINQLPFFIWHSGITASKMKVVWISSLASSVVIKVVLVNQQCIFLCCYKGGSLWINNLYLPHSFDLKLFARSTLPRTAASMVVRAYYTYRMKIFSTLRWRRRGDRRVLSSDYLLKTVILRLDWKVELYEHCRILYLYKWRHE